MDRKEHEACLLSGSKDLFRLKGYEEANLVKSKPLGFIFSKSIPTKEQLVKHYDRYSRQDYLSPVTIKRFDELLAVFEKYRKNNRILDVGCGVGYFLQHAITKGWEVYGTEFTDAAIESCSSKGINMKQGTISTDWYEKDSFDIITSFEVIEHINNPLDEVKNFYQLLRKGGLLYFTTPNFNCFERFWLKSAYSVICYPEHLCYYTPKTIDFLMKQVGLKKVSLTTSGISISRLSNSYNNQAETVIENKELVSSTTKDERLRVWTENFYVGNIIKILVNGMLNTFGIGNTIKGVYMK
jgi:2-polyprenyl-3-methyl-5-hydroxy-6-metoxy-1,4-benzoquinol methylase